MSQNKQACISKLPALPPLARTGFWGSAVRVFVFSQPCRTHASMEFISTAVPNSKQEGSPRTLQLLQTVNIVISPDFPAGAEMQTPPYYAGDSPLSWKTCWASATVLASWEHRGRRIAGVKEFHASLGNTVRPLSSPALKKNQPIKQH